MSPSEVFVACSALAFSGLIVWWMRHAPSRIRGLLVSRGEALEDDGEVFNTQPRTSDRDEWDSHTADAVLLTHEAVDLDDAVHDVDFTEFETEFADSKRAQRWAAQLEERAK